MFQNNYFKSKKLIHLAWKLLIISIVIIAAYVFIDFKSLINTYTLVTLPWIIILILLATLDRIMMAVKWHLLIRLIDIKISLAQAIRIYYEASFLTHVLPSSLTGDAHRAYTANKISSKLSKILSSIFAEKFIAIISSGLLACVGIILLHGILKDTKFNSLIWLIPAIFSFVLAIFLYTLLSKKAKLLIEIIPIKSIKKIGTKLYTAYELYAQNKIGLLANFFLAISEHLLQYSVFYFSALALQINFSPLELIGILAITQFVRKFAIILEGWFLGEFFTIAGCVLIGINQTDALAFSLLRHATLILAALPGSYFLLLNNSKK